MISIVDKKVDFVFHNIEQGLDEFSMSASSILAARELVSRINFKDAQKLANLCLEADNEQEVIEILNKNSNW